MTEPASSDDANAASKSRPTMRKNFDKKRTDAARELLTTEYSYVRGLMTLIHGFLAPLKELIAPADVSAIFSNIEVIFKFHKEFLKDLKARVDSASWNPLTSLLGDIFISITPYLKLYTQYCSNYDAALSTIHRLRDSSPRFREFELRAMADPVFGGKQITAFLIMPIRTYSLPFQSDYAHLISTVERIPRYQLLLSAILEHTPEDHPDYENLCKSLSLVKTLAEFINQRIAEAENLKKIAELAKQLSIDLVKPSRKLVMDNCFAVLYHQPEFPEMHGSKKDRRRERSHERRTSLPGALSTPHTSALSSSGSVLLTSTGEKMNLYLFNNLVLITHSNRVYSSSDLWTTWIKADNPAIPAFQIITPAMTVVLAAETVEERNMLAFQFADLVKAILDTNANYAEERSYFKVKRDVILNTPLGEITLFRAVHKAVLLQAIAGIEGENGGSADQTAQQEEETDDVDKLLQNRRDTLERRLSPRVLIPAGRNSGIRSISGSPLMSNFEQKEPSAVQPVSVVQVAVASEENKGSDEPGDSKELPAETNGPYSTDQSQTAAKTDAEAQPVSQELEPAQAAAAAHEKAMRKRDAWQQALMLKEEEERLRRESARSRTVGSLVIPKIFLGGDSPASPISKVRTSNTPCSPVQELRRRRT